MHATSEDMGGRAVSLRLTPVLGIGTLPEAAGMQFSLEAKLGGGQGRHAVHVGTDHQLNTRLAYKRIPKGIIALQPTFFREARLLHQSRHRHVVPIMYACEASDYVYCASTPKFPQFVNRQSPAGTSIRMGGILPPAGPPGWG